MKSITLIGMPGAGKSTIGRSLASRLGFKFVDLDILIKEKEGKSHGQILREKGESELLKLEESYALSLDFSKTVFSPGGSIIYSPSAMDKLRKDTIIIYLDLPLVEIAKRLGKHLNRRGIIGLAQKGLDRLFAERTAIYEKTAHYHIYCLGLSDEEIIKKINNEILQHQQ